MKNNIIALLIFISSFLYAEDQLLSLTEFISLTAKNSYYQELLIEKLKVKYQNQINKYRGQTVTPYHVLTNLKNKLSMVWLGSLLNLGRI